MGLAACPCHLPAKPSRLELRPEPAAPSRVTMAVSTQQLAEELQIFGLDCEDSLMEKRESGTEGVASKCRMLMGCRLGPD